MATRRSGAAKVPARQPVGMKLFLPLFLLLASPVLAEPVVHRLSDAERERVIAQAAQGPERAPVLTAERPAANASSVLTTPLYPELDGGDGLPDRRVHGEVSAFVGTGGARGFAGSMAAPLGDDGQLGLAFSTSRLPGFGQTFGGQIFIGPNGNRPIFGGPNFGAFGSAFDPAFFGLGPLRQRR